MYVQTTPFGSYFKALLVALICIPSFVFAQREQVQLKVRNAAPLRVFEYHQPSSFEVVNGKFNAAIASANGYVLELNGISVKSLKCKSTLKQNQFKVVLTDNRLQNRVYLSTSKSAGTLKVNCLPNGDYELIYSGDIYLDNQKVTVSATLSGAVAHSKNLKNN